MSSESAHDTIQAPEIEITPEMIEAGRAAFLDFDSRFEDVEDAVREIYLAMVSVKEGWQASI